MQKKIEHCERVYNRRGLSPIFRLIEPFESSDLDSALAERGYEKFHPTRVMGLDLNALDSTNSKKGILMKHRLNPWLKIFSLLSGYSPEKQPLHKKILENIPTTPLFVSSEISGQPTTCGLGVLQDELIGLFDIVTHPEYRNQGIGTQLVREMLNWGQEQGAEQAYLQVMESNMPARHLYTKLGFQDLYRYWYRVPKSA
ncbi:MAG: GNAT family N-acetyltransferase [Chloroflexi bacterium]|nr:GNAT family N-acetyltransferase [Chloroflexota bacterium]